MFFFNDTATTEIYTLSLHDALPISPNSSTSFSRVAWPTSRCCRAAHGRTTPASCSPLPGLPNRSEEHTSELQSHLNIVCRLLLEKKNHGRGSDHRCRLSRMIYLHTI